jgi:hypothetical protein
MRDIIIITKDGKKPFLVDENTSYYTSRLHRIGRYKFVYSPDGHEASYINNIMECCNVLAYYFIDDKQQIYTYICKDLNEENELFHVRTYNEFKNKIKSNGLNMYIVRDAILNREVYKTLEENDPLLEAFCV